MMFTVYMIRHRATGKAYVGITTMPLTRRVYHHMQRGTCVGRAMAQDGADAFEVLTLSTHATKDAGLEAESAAIWKHGTHAPDGYNHRARGGRYPGCGGAGEGNKNSRRRAVSAYDKQGNKVQDYPTIMDAAKALGVQRNTIHRAIINPHYTSGGFHWRDAGSPAPHGG